MGDPCNNIEPTQIIIFLANKVNKLLHLFNQKVLQVSLKISGDFVVVLLFCSSTFISNSVNFDENNMFEYWAL